MLSLVVKMIKRILGKINLKKVVLLLLVLLFSFQVYNSKIVEPTESELLKIYKDYQKNITDKTVLPSEYQYPDTPVPKYFLNDITILLTKQMKRYIYKGSKLADKEMETYTNFVHSQILKQQMIQQFDIKIEKVVYFDYKITRANLKLLVSTNKEILISDKLEKINTEEYYKVHFRKQEGDWKIFWIERENF
jgi:hypothetical protein